MTSLIFDVYQICWNFFRTYKLGARPSRVQIYSFSIYNIILFTIFLTFVRRSHMCKFTKILNPIHPLVLNIVNALWVIKLLKLNSSFATCRSLCAVVQAGIRWHFWHVWAFLLDNCFVVLHGMSLVTTERRQWHALKPYSICIVTALNWSLIWCSLAWNTSTYAAWITQNWTLSFHCKLLLSLSILRNGSHRWRCRCCLSHIQLVFIDLPQPLKTGSIAKV